jgi:hypothetical protein
MLPIAYLKYFRLNCRARAALLPVIRNLNYLCFSSGGSAAMAAVADCSTLPAAVLVEAVAHRPRCALRRVPPRRSRRTRQATGAAAVAGVRAPPHDARRIHGSVPCLTPRPACRRSPFRPPPKTKCVSGACCECCVCLCCGVRTFFCSSSSCAFLAIIDPVFFCTVLLRARKPIALPAPFWSVLLEAALATYLLSVLDAIELPSLAWYSLVHQIPTQAVVS